jgi:hypothetical protein
LDRAYDLNEWSNRNWVYPVSCYGFGSLVPILETVSPKIKKRGSQLMMNVVGAGLSERIRATIAGMLGVTTAAGLALFLFLFQASWPIPTLGPLVFPPASKEGLQRGVALGGSDAGTGAAGSGASRTAAGGAVSGSGAALAVVVPPSTTGTTTTDDNGTTGFGGSATGVEQGQNAAAGGSQPATPSPASPVRQPAGNPAPETPAGAESTPVAVPVPPVPAPEVPAVPTEVPPVEGELPPETEEPPLEEEVEEPPVEEGEEVEEPLLRPTEVESAPSGE